MGDFCPFCIMKCPKWPRSFVHRSAGFGSSYRIIQEISLAKKATLYCGKMRIRWSDFAEAVSILESVRPEDQIMSNGTLSPNQANLSDILSEIPLLAATRLVKLTNSVFRKSDQGTMLEKVITLEVLMSELSSFQVSRPHDVIYAVLGLAKDISSIHGATDSNAINSMLRENQAVQRGEGIPQVSRVVQRAVYAFRQSINPFFIDYNKDFLDLCKDFLRMTINSEGSLDMLCRPWVPVLENRTLPSWLMSVAQTAHSVGPDGTYYRSNADTLVGCQVQGKGSYNASRKKKAKTWDSSDEEMKRHSLFVDGFIVDFIGERKQYSRDGLIPNEWLTTGGWNDLTAAPPAVFWKTLVANRGPEGKNCPLVYPRACKVLIPPIDGDDISTTTLLNESRSRSVTKFLGRVQAVICMRSLIKTKRHHFLGLAPMTAESGDLICILYGCSVPVVLRSFGSKETHDLYYRFIGECYVHGLMEAEAFDIQMEEELAQQLNPERDDNSTSTEVLTAQKTFEIR